eukprot:m51a1_g147 hypothetical protein (289) ;mRNA; f:471808-472674
MAPTRKVARVVKPLLTEDGDGVAIKRTIGARGLDNVDPFLLLDHFGSADPDQYMAGFPRHPHAGIETVTYMKHGHVTHRDSCGNEGTIGPGDLQWMTAGRGILHEEMPVRDDGDPRVEGFQLWLSLPRTHKRCAPRYQDVRAGKVPETVLASGARVKVIAGEVGGVVGPIREVVADPTYLDVELQPGGSFEHAAPAGHSVVCYLYEGEGLFGAEGCRVSEESAVVFEGEGALSVRTPADAQGATRFLVLAGKKIGEPIVRYGPFVTNSQAEVQEILRSVRAGTFPPSE